MAPRAFCEPPHREIDRGIQRARTYGHLILRNLYFVALDPSSTRPYTEIVDSWREVPAGSLALAEIALIERPQLDAKDFAGWLQLLAIYPYCCRTARGSLFFFPCRLHSCTSLRY